MRPRTARSAGAALLVLAAALLTSLGLSAEAHAEPTTYALTEADNGRRITVQVGDAVTVRLVPPADARWTAPYTGRSRLYRRSVLVSADASVATFVATGVAEATITSAVDHRCEHLTSPCDRALRSFRVVVSITEGPSSSPAGTPTPGWWGTCHSASPSPPHEPAAGTGLSLTQEDEGASVSLAVGQRLHAALTLDVQDVSAPRGLFLEQWRIDKEQADPGCPSSSTALLTFDAVSPDRGAVHASDEAVCGGSICGRPDDEWTALVGVGPAGSTATSAVSTADRPTITAGNSPTITASLRTETGAAGHGYVTLYAKRYGEASYAKLATSYAEGTASFVVRPELQTAYVAEVTNVHGRRASAAQVVQVHARVVVEHPPANGGFDGPSTLVTGYLLPRRGSVPVGVLAPLGRGYRFLGQSPTGADGRFAVRITGMAPGWTVLTVYTSARAGTLRGSTRVRVQVA